MKEYVDGFVIPILKKNVAAYKKMAAGAGKVWMDHGAIQYIECVGDDLKAMNGTPGFRKMLKAKPNETVLFSWVVYESKAHRNKVNAAVMKDPRIAEMMKDKMLFDVKKMLYGGFKPIVKN